MIVDQRRIADAEQELAHLVALNGLPGMGPLRLTAMLEGRTALDAWAEVSAGRASPARLGASLAARLAPGWASAARKTGPAELLETYRAAGVDIWSRHDERFPSRLAKDPEAPLLIFSRGDVRAAQDALVAIVGTRRATTYGARVARRLGRELTDAGVNVVSGLAAGIDAAGHAGALEVEGARPVGIVGSGLDVVYPRRNRWLWDAVAERGALIGEAPLGARPERWRFPARNRLVAALARAVVVVESHAAGGSLLTADEAAGRSLPVLAVPGSIFSPASVGTNRLISAGAQPALDVEDVLVAIGQGGSRARPGPVSDAPRTDPDQACVLAAVGWEPIHLDELATRSALPVGRLALALDGLEQIGLIGRDRGMVLRVG